MIRTIFGWAIQLSNPMEAFGKTYVHCRLTENSVCPGQEILAYPCNLIKDTDDGNA